jgi:hypothetical protein
MTGEPKELTRNASQTLGNDLALILATYSRYMSIGQPVSITFELELIPRWRIIGDPYCLEDQQKPLPPELSIRNLAFSDRHVDGPNAS